jgi:cytochrome c
MKTALLALAAAGLFAAGGAMAAESGAELFKAKGCGNCHDATAKKVGPSIQDVASKSKGDKAAADRITAKLKDGKGHMKAAASESEIKAMVNYMLAGK